MRLARWVFLLAGVSGAIMMLPLYFMEEKLGRDLPPTVNHPELYYGFIGVTLAWQFMFLVIARDPIRYRSAMLPALFEKASYAGALLALFARNRVPDEMLAFAAMDATWFVLFAIAYWRTNSTPNTEQSRRPAMNDDFASLFAFNRWANSKMLDACRKLTPEQYSAEPVPGWSSVRVTVWHIAVVTDGWLRGLVNDPDESFPTEAELATVDDAQRILERAYGRFDQLLPTLTAERLAAPVTLQRRGRSATLPPWVVLRHIVNHTTYHRGQVASKLKRFGIQQAESDFVFWALEMNPLARKLP